MKTNDARLLGALGLLTLATGMVDAASVLGLGRIFTANMTGNVVLLGFALAGAGGAAASACLAALAAFLAGALLGGRLAARGVSFTSALALELLLLTAAAVVAWLADGARSSTRLTEIVLLGFAMGLHNASVRKLGVADMTTTVLTLTLTGLAADSGLAGGESPRRGRRLASVVLMLAGAVAGALLLRWGIKWTISGGALTVAGACLLSAFSPTGETGASETSAAPPR